MSNQPDETLNLSGDTVKLYRGVEFKRGAQVETVGDHMVIQYMTGNSDDLVVLKHDGKLVVRRLVGHLEIQMPSSPAVGSSSSTGSFSFAPLPADEEARLLLIYKMFKAK